MPDGVVQYVSKRRLYRDDNVPPVSVGETRLSTGDHP
jgi:nicotinate-nucleotide adenylyltransferase